MPCWNKSAGVAPGAMVRDAAPRAAPHHEEQTKCPHPEEPTVAKRRWASRRMAAHALFVVLLGAPAVAADDLAVEVVNASEPTLCAEKDNVTLNLMSGDVRRFTVEAVHPAYMGTLLVDRAAPDFRHCAMGSDPAFKFEPRRFWRGAQVPVRAGNRVENGLHLIQLWKRFQERAEEVLVLYPADAYWRARPLPPAHLRWSAYGSSFLIGPIEAEGRPFVDISEVAFDPATRTFRLSFRRGGTATLRVDALDQEHIVLDIGLAATIAPERPFAALRSMFVTETNADTAQVAWRPKGSEAWQQAPIMSFKRAGTVELWAGRSVPSRHNTSAPDMVFREFSGAR